MPLKLNERNIANKHNRLKNPNWWEADQLGIYKVTILFTDFLHLLFIDLVSQLTELFTVMSKGNENSGKYL